MKRMGSRKLLGKRIYSQDGTEIGEVQGLEIEVDRWRIETIEAKLDRSVLDVLKLKKTLFGTHSVRIDVSRIAGVDDRVVLKDDLKNVWFVADEQPR